MSAREWGRVATTSDEGSGLINLTRESDEAILDTLFAGREDFSGWLVR